MKVLAVLVLAVLTGCNANLFQADAPKSQLEMIQDSFWAYVRQATQTAEETIAAIKRSEYGQEISARLTESTEIANRYATTLQEQLPPGTQDMIAKVTAEAELLKQRVNSELDAVRERLQPFVDQMNAQLKQKVELLKQDIVTFSESRGLTNSLVQRSNELKTTLEDSARDLQAKLGPYTEEMKSKVDHHLEEFKLTMAPLAEKVQAEIIQKAQDAKEMATPYVEEVREKLDPYANDLQARLAALYESFAKPQ